ncbi:DUF3592 domain-containing protein [Streptomyces sp. NPDC005423]|uniref:DUF3592 domain-containing protein n=1 Tax=Streptomyces sp. NPDC005423 TaxID=3155343 RepID=UPI0033B922E8
MEALFYVIPLLMIALAVFGAVSVVRRSRQVSGAWSGGLTAEATCLRTYTTTGGGGESMVHTTMHHVYEFTTREGRAVRFDEANGPSTTVQGDLVTVYYAADHPEQATAHAPAPGKLAAGTGCLLTFFGVFILFCLGFMLMVHGVFSVADDFLHS